MSRRIKQRLTGTAKDLAHWIFFLELLQNKGLITIVERSEPYANRGHSTQYRVYLEIDLNIEPPSN
jgi:hypothetical protein